MKGTLLGISASVITMIIINLITMYLFNIPDFTSGWICCVVFLFVKHSYESRIIENTQVQQKSEQHKQL